MKFDSSPLTKNEQPLVVNQLRMRFGTRSPNRALTVSPTFSEKRKSNFGFAQVVNDELKGNRWNLRKSQEKSNFNSQSTIFFLTFLRNFGQV